jgi:hypothetical protein
LRELAAKMGMKVFEMEACFSDELLLLDMVALSIDRLGAEGIYRVPAQHLKICMANRERPTGRRGARSP